MTCRIAFVAALSAAAIACGGSDEDPSAAPPQRGQRIVVFEYVAATSVDPGIAERFPACVQGVGQTHIHPSWRGFERVDLTPANGRWTFAFEDVPAGTRERIRVSDANACAEHPTGAATRNVFANGVRLTEIVDTPGSGTEPGLAFTLAADGTVTP